MPRTLYLTTELPYFPGQGGLMALQVRYLAGIQFTGVVGPRYPHQPEDSLQKMRDTVQRSYWWPEHPVPGDYLSAPVLGKPQTRWLRFLPKIAKRRLWLRLAGLNRYSDDALVWRAVLVNLAPKILEALKEERWNVLYLSQSLSVSWLPFLPASLSRCLLFNDIRSDYLSRSPAPPSRSNLRRILNEERDAARLIEGTVVLSELDRGRAETLLQPAHPVAVVPLCLDLDYFAFHPAEPTAPPVVLFTGHLSHPPNVDAAVYFLSAIWPRIVAAVPGAIFKIVGLHPAPALVQAVQQSQQVELLPNVPDIRPFYHEAKAYVVPMRYGGGVRQKILEAWAVGVPVVSTTMGMEGIAAVDGANCWLRDTPETFADQLSALLRAPLPTAQLQAARSQVETHHSAAATCPALVGQINLALRRRRESAPKILFDLRWLNPGKAGGVEQMTYELVDELAAFDRTFAYRFYGPGQSCRHLQFPPEFKQSTILSDDRQARRHAWRKAAVLELGADLGEPALTSPELDALAWYTRLDFTVVHGLPSHVAPEFRRFPSVVTMHDLQHLHLPENFLPADLAVREREYRESCRLANHIICTSEFTRQDVHQRYGVPLEKMTTIWNLPPRRSSVPMPQATVDGHLRAMGVKAPFLFYPAQPWVHKNHRGLLEAIRLIDRSLPADYRLVLTGQPFPPDHPATTLMADPVVQRRVLHLGYRSAREISALYRSAEALVFPSLFEGFGLPLIEAMQQGCPIISGQHTCLPEIAGDAALFTTVASPDALGSAILAITGDAALRTRLRQAGALNLRRFDRRALAEKTRAIYASVHEEHFA